MKCPITFHECQTAVCLERSACAMQRGAAYSQVQQEVGECPSCKSKGFAKSVLGADRCEFCDGSFSGNPPTEIERAQAEILEAHSLKYHHCAQIFQLSSGRYALFGHFSNDHGIPLLAIGTWSEIEPHVQGYRVLADQATSQPRKTAPKAEALEYDDLFGES